MNVYHMSVTWGLYIRHELCGYCTVIVRLLCGANEESVWGADNLPNVGKK